MTGEVMTRVQCRGDEQLGTRPVRFESGEELLLKGIPKVR